VPAAFNLFTLVAFVLTVAMVHAFNRSPFGASLRGTRDQPRRMAALGYHVWLIRFLAVLFSGLVSGSAGLLFVYYHQFVCPHVLGLAS
jgi:branched-chain amino acid transport system permease protein